MMQELPDLPVPASQPIPDPVDVLDATRTAWAAGAYALAVVVVLLAVARGLYYAAERYPHSGFVNVLNLGSSRVRAVLTGTISVLAALLLELGTTTGMDFGVIAGALCAAVALFLRPEPKGKAPDIATTAAPPMPDNVVR
jgi:hypothetical protein